MIEETRPEGTWSWIVLNDEGESLVEMDDYETEVDARRGWNDFLRAVSRPIEFVTSPYDGQPYPDAETSEEE